MRRALFLPLFLSLFICLLPCPPSFAGGEPDPQATVAMEGEDTRSIQEALDSMLESQVAQIEGILKHTQELGKNINASFPRIRSSLTLLGQEYQKVNALSQSSSGIPTELTFLGERLHRIKEKAVSILNPLQTDMDMLNREKQALDAIGSSLASYADAEVKQKTDTAMQNASRNIAILLSRYGSIVSVGADILEQTRKRLDSLMTIMPSLWKDYYLESSGYFYDIAKWGTDLRAISSVSELFSLRMNTELPSGISAWLVALARIASAMAVFILASLVFFRTVGNSISEQTRKGISRIVRNSLIWIALGISMHFAAWSEGTLYMLVASAGTMCLCWGELTLAWDLYSFDQPDRPLLSPLYPIFPPLLAGMILLNLDPFPHFICVAWLILQIFDIWFTHRRPLPSMPMPRVIMQIYNVQRWIALVISLIGYARLSILINMLFSAFAVTIMLTISIIRVEHAIEERLPKEGTTAVVSGLTLALVMPFILLTAFSAIVFWILAYPGGAFLLMHFASLGFSIGGFSLNAMQVLSILIAFYLTKSLLTVGNTFMTEMRKQISRISQTLIAPLQIIFKYVMWALFGLYALKALGFNLSSLSMIAGGLSVGIGIGLQNIVQNFTSGLMVIFARTVKEGDVLQVDGHLGVVKKVNIRSTVLETYDNATIFIPNSTFLNGSFTNWTHNNRLVRKDIAVGVAYGSDIKKCMELLLSAAGNHPKVMYFPAPVVLFTEFGASSLDLILRFWVREYNDALNAASDIRVRISEIFAENGIEISFPQMDVHVRSDSELKIRDVLSAGTEK